MLVKKAYILFVVFLLSCSPGGESGTATNNGNNNNNANCSDFDEDNICDSDEGKDVDRDTDDDGTPDWYDTDSDNDGIPDIDEAGDDDKSTPPLDSDLDGTPDYIDADSDNNGIPDKVEGTSDLDNDGIPNYADPDNDGDAIPDKVEIGGDAYNPQNTDENLADSDMIPDYNDVDSDNDGIGDIYEHDSDADGDGVPNYIDQDSDNDGISDKDESGTGGDVTLPPVDSDNDSHPDFLDADSDNDGLPDGQEDVNHNGVVDQGESDPKNADTDGDGVSDLIEMAAGTNALDPNDNPRENGDFVFMEPYEDTPDPTEDVLNFSTAFQKIDLLFVEDVSGSMSSEINSVRDGLISMLNNITCAPGEDPATTHCIPDVESGIITFGDGSNQYVLNKALDNNNVPSDPGADSSCTYNLLPTNAPGAYEEPVSAMNASVTGSCSSDPARIGRACFRDDALKVILLITDEDLNEDSQYPNFQSYYDNLVGAGVRTIIDYGAGSSSDINNLINDLSAAQSGGTYLVPELNTTDLSSIPACSGITFQNNRAIVQGADTNAGPALTCAVQAIGSLIAQDVEAWIINDPNNVDALGNAVDAPAVFIDYIEVFMVDGDHDCPAGYNTVDSNSDTYEDKYLGIYPGNPVCWKIHVKENVVVEAAEEPQMFMATVEVHGEGGAILDTRDVYFLVPPDIKGPGVVN